MKKAQSKVPVLINKADFGSVPAVRITLLDVVPCRFASSPLVTL